MSNLYLLRDGTYADPKDCKKDDDGVLRHPNGIAVALKADGEPETIEDATATNAKAAAGAELATTVNTAVAADKPAKDKAA